MTEAFTGNRSGENMAVIDIRQREAGDQCLIVGDIGVRQDRLHPLARRFKPRDRGVGRIGGQVAHPFSVDIIRPARIDQAVERALDQDIAQMEGVENAGIKDRDRRPKDHD